MQATTEKQYLCTGYVKILKKKKKLVCIYDKNHIFRN